MHPASKLWRSALVALAVFAALLAGAVLVVTRTDWGRERVRRIALEQLRAAAEGEVRIGAVRGNLLGRITLVDVAITDAQGRPFVAADTISTRYSLRGLISRRVALRGLRLVNAAVVLDKPPGEEWNFVRIFPRETAAPAPTRPGWGDWVALDDVEIVNGRVTIRTAWQPSEDLSPAEREEAIRLALAGETRDRIVRVNGGFQNVMDFRELYATLPRVRVAHPDSAAIPIEVARLRGIAEPFRPPAAAVHDLAGEFYLAQDSLHFRRVQAVLPGSRIAAEGVYALDTGDLLLQLRGAPVALADLRWLYPPLPEEGGGTLQLSLRREGPKTSFIARDAALRVGSSQLGGRMTLVLGDSLRLEDTDLRFADFDTRLLERVLPALDVPRHGRLSGRLALAGSPEALRLEGDVAFADARAGTSRVQAAGELTMASPVEFHGLRLSFDPLQAELVRAFAPALPLRGTITGRATLSGSSDGVLRLESDLALRDPRAGLSRVRAQGGVDLRDELRLRDLRLNFEPLRLELLRGELPGLPAGAAARGHLRLDGAPARALALEGDLVVDDPSSGTSRLRARGAVATGEAIRFRDLELGFDPLQVTLLRGLAPGLPLGGELAGRARLNGSPAAQLAAQLDLEHREAGERSRVAGRAELAPRGTGWAALDLRLLPLSLRTLGRFAPAAGLRGQVSGTLRARGSLRALAVQAELELPDGGALAGRGTLDLAAAETGYDLDTRLHEFDLAAVTTRAPATTSLSGTLSARGRGFDPARMRATLAADLAGAEVEGFAADAVRLRLAIAEGLARVDSSAVRIGATRATADGSFGLVAGRTGELAYRVEIDSLHAFAPWVAEADSGVVAARPAVRQAVRAHAEREAERRARRARVERLATGREPAAPPARDTLIVPDIPRDSLAGRLHAAGTLRGNLERFDLTGRAEMERLVFRGNYVGAGSADYTLLALGTTEPTLRIRAAVDSLLAGGFALEHAEARVDYRGERYGTGRAVLAARADERRDYRADVEFTLSLDRNEVRLHETALRFDTVTWASTRPGAVRWGGRGVDVETIELRSDAGGRIYLDGRLPVEGAAALDVEVENLQLADVVALLQDDAEAAGVLRLDARVEGTLASPRFEGDLGLVAVRYQGRELPDAQGRLAYAGTALDADLELLREGRVLARAQGRLPIDLALAERSGPRLLGGEIALDVRADSLPLDALPSFTDDIEDVRGRVVGELAVRGSLDDPALSGRLDLDLASFRIVPLGVRFEEIAGTLRMQGATLVVDSLVARSRGPIRIDGTMDLGRLTEPGFDLRLQAEDAQVLDTDQGRLWIDAELAVQGPFDGVEITGDVHTRRGVIYVPETRGQNVVNLEAPEVREAVDTARIERVAPRGSPLVENLRVAVNLHVARDTWIRSTDANVEIYTPPEVGPLAVDLDRRARRLTLEGTVNSDRGQYSFLGHRFELTRGAATFVGDPQLNPLLQIAAEHEVRLPGREGFSIRIVIGGVLREPTVALESTAQPPISQTDLLSYLAFGRSSAALLQQQGSSLSGPGAGTGVLVGEVAGLATQQLATVAVNALVDEFESDAARSLGLDVLNISPAPLPAEIASGRFDVVTVLRGTEIEAGSYLSPRLFAATQLRPTLITPGARLEYRTPQGFRWTVGWEPRFLPSVPSLAEREPQRATVFGSFLLREWRF